jgi:hypothetical protein
MPLKRESNREHKAEAGRPFSGRMASLLLLGLTAALALIGDVGAAQPGQGSSGRIYKWVDEHGVTHYGQSIPPEYRDKPAAEMNKRGLTVNRIDPAATAAERQAAQDKAVRDREEQKRLAEQRRRDTALMNTYSSAREIDDARERSLSGPAQALRMLDPRLKKAEERLQLLNRQANEVQRAGKPVPEFLAEDISHQKLEVEQLLAERRRHETQIAVIRARYDADRQRYVELTQLGPR